MDDGLLSNKLNKPLTIKSGDLVLLRLPSGEIRSVKIENNSTIVIGKLGNFHANELIDHSYGLTYEVNNRKLNVIPPRTLKEVDDTDATNEYINDGEFVQPLTSEEIQTLKQSGVHASDIIKKQIEQHANYALKTEYSKEKYKKRKETKYSKFFTTIEPTIFNVCEFWFVKDQNRIRDIRIDSLAQMLNLANVQPGGCYICVDDASGLLVAGILDRMQGDGRLLTICDTDSPPPYPVISHMNFGADITRPLVSLNWATAEESYTPILAPRDVSLEQLRSEGQKSRLNKRKLITNLLMSIREELFAGGFNSLLIASQYDPYSIIERLSTYLAGSASIVVHSPHVQVLTDLQTKLRSHGRYLSPAVTETWLRRYQVLPGRTHPMMAMSGSGGHVLHTIKVYDDPTASGVVIRRQPKIKKAKSEGNEVTEPSHCTDEKDQVMPT